MRTWLCLPVVAATVLGAVSVGCSRDKPAPAPATTGSAAATATPGVELFVNDATVGTILPAQIAGWTRLDTLVPADARKLGTWALIRLEGAGPKPTEIARPSGAYPDMVPAVFPGEAGSVAFGMFDPVELARRGKPAIREDRVRAIRIELAQGGNRGQNDDGGGAAGDPTKLVLTVKTPAGTTTLTGDKLLAIPREAMPGNADQKGWRLATLLDAAGVKAYDHLVLTDASGTNLTLDRKDLDDKTVPFIKLNKQGALRLRVLKQVGEGWNPAGDLRALVAIDAR
jgi:hypothetical protein